MASGAKDTTIIVWDVLAQQGLFKLRGHTDQITDLQFFSIKVADTTWCRFYLI